MKPIRKPPVGANFCYRRMVTKRDDYVTEYSPDDANLIFVHKDGRASLNNQSGDIITPYAHVEDMPDGEYKNICRRLWHEYFGA